MSWPAIIARRQGAYKRLFLAESGQVGADALFVLADLRSFCHHNRSTLKVSPITRTVDPLATMIAEGRREVILRIFGYLELDPRQVREIVEQPEE